MTPIKIDFARMGNLLTRTPIVSIDLAHAKWTTHRRSDEPIDGDLKTEVARNQIRWEYDNSEKRIEVFVPYSVKVTDTGSGRLIIESSSIWRLVYDISAVELPDRDEAVVSDFAYCSGLMTSYPYFRQHLHDMGARGGFPGLILDPIIRPSTRDTGAVARVKHVRAAKESGGVRPKGVADTTGKSRKRKSPQP